MFNRFRLFCQRVLPIVYDDSLSFQELLYKVVCKINEVIYAINDMDTQTEIKQIMQEWLEDGTLEQIITEAYSEFIASVGLFPKTVKGNVLMNIFTKNEGMQGGCYIGDEKIVIYQPTANNNTGNLMCYNINDKSFVWSYPIEGYHGNTLSFEDGKLYITACIDQTGDSSNIIDIIQVIDINNPDTIIQTMHLNRPVYSAVVYKGELYCLSDRDFSIGSANIIYVYDLEGNEIRHFAIKNLINTTSQLRTQGITCIVDDILYICDHNTYAIYGHSIKTGDLVYAGKVEQYMNKYRRVGDLQFMTKAGNKWLLGHVLNSTGERLVRLNTIAEIGLYNAIPLNDKRPLGLSAANPVGTNARVWVTNDLSKLNPAADNVDTVPTLDDAINLCRCWGVPGRIQIAVPEGFEGLNYIINDFTGFIFGAASNKIPVYNLVIQDCHDISLNNLDFANANNSTRTINEIAYTAHIFVVRSELTGLNWDGSSDKEMCAIYSDLKLASPIQLSRFSWASLGTRSNWSGSITDPEKYMTYTYTLDA